MTLAEVAARAPNLMVLPSEPYEFGPEHAREIEREVAGVPIAFVDGRDLFWWGIRTPPPPTASRPRSCVCDPHVVWVTDAAPKKWALT